MNKIGLCFFALFSSGCMKTYVYRSPDLSPETAFPTLMVHTGVQVEQSWHIPGGDDSITGEDIVQLAVDMSQNRQVHAFGERLLVSTEPFLDSQGLQVVIEPERAKDVRAVDWTQFRNRSTVLSGNWSDPRGGVMPLVPTLPFRESIYDSVSETLQEGQTSEGYLYIVGTVHQRGILRPYPKLAVTFVVHDETGEELLVAQGVGKGKRSFMVLDRTPENLAAALSSALGSLEEAEVKSLESTISPPLAAVTTPPKWTRRVASAIPREVDLSQ